MPAVRGEGTDEGRMVKVRRTEEQQDGLLKSRECAEGFSNRGETVKWTKMKHSHRGSRGGKKKVAE